MSDLRTYFDNERVIAKLREENDALRAVHAELTQLRALARRVHAECGPKKVKQEDEVFLACKCGAVGITELNHPPDCLWLAADAVLRSSTPQLRSGQASSPQEGAEQP